MNAPVETVTLKIGDGTLIVPAEGLARVWLDHQLGRHIIGSTAGNVQPPIGEPLDGGRYVGLTLYGNAPHRLILLPGDIENRHKDCAAWADDQGGVLPSRIDGLVLLEHVKSEFQPTWYWLDELCAHLAYCAWVQFFASGSQGITPTSSRYRARAVRRVAI